MKPHPVTTIMMLIIALILALPAPRKRNKNLWRRPSEPALSGAKGAR